MCQVLYGKDLGEIARVVPDDGGSDNRTVALARLGDHGRCPEHTLRDLRRLIRREGILGELGNYKVELAGIHGASVPIILPHEALHGIWRESHAEFLRRFVGTEDELARY